MRWNQRRYPNATRLLITADGGSNGSQVRLWKRELQVLANELGMAITVCHLPPGTSEVAAPVASDQHCMSPACDTVRLVPANGSVRRRLYSLEGQSRELNRLMSFFQIGKAVVAAI